MTPHEKIPDSYEFAVEVWEVINVAELQVVITGENQTRSSAAHLRVQCTSGGNLKNRAKKKGKTAVQSFISCRESSLVPLSTGPVGGHFCVPSSVCVLSCDSRQTPARAR